MLKYYFISLLISSAVSIGCNSSNKLINTAKTDTISHLNLNIKENNKIVFLTFDMSLIDSTKDRYSFTLINKIISEGILKKHLFKEEKSIEKNYLYISFSNQGGQESDWIKVNDPLNMLYEYPTSENNDLGKSVISQNKGILTFRFQADSNFNFISIYKPTADLKLKKIYYASL